MPIFKLSRDKNLWFPDIVSLWISFHQKKLNKETKKKLKNIKNLIFVLKKIIKEIIKLKDLKET